MKETSCLEYDCNEQQMYILLDIEAALTDCALTFLTHFLISPPTSF